MLNLTNTAKAPSKADLTTYRSTLATIGKTTATKTVAGEDVPLTAIDCANSLPRFIDVTCDGSLTKDELDTAKTAWAKFQAAYQFVEVNLDGAKVIRVGVARTRWVKGMPVSRKQTLQTEREYTTQEQVDLLSANLEAAKAALDAS
tara:strand:- start:22 stop:459 length:438 start_codon:yes stop_codon:yes gene_type:complete